MMDGSVVLHGVMDGNDMATTNNNDDDGWMQFVSVLIQSTVMTDQSSMPPTYSSQILLIAQAIHRIYSQHAPLSVPDTVTLCIGQP